MLEESGGGFSTWDEIFFYIFFSSNRIRVLYRKKIAVALKVGTMLLFLSLQLQEEWSFTTLLGRKVHTYLWPVTENT